MSCRIDSFKDALDGRDDLIRGLGPDEGFRVLVHFVEVVADRLLELLG